MFLVVLPTILFASYLEIEYNVSYITILRMILVINIGVPQYSILCP